MEDEDAVEDGCLFAEQALGMLTMGVVEVLNVDLGPSLRLLKRAPHAAPRLAKDDRLVGFDALQALGLGIVESLVQETLVSANAPARDDGRWQVAAEGGGGG